MAGLALLAVRIRASRQLSPLPSITVERIWCIDLSKSGHSVQNELLLAPFSCSRQYPRLASRQIIRSRFFAFGRERRLADALDPQPPRRIRARAVRVALTRERQSVFSGRRQRRRRQPRHVNMPRGTARGRQQTETHRQNSGTNHKAHSGERINETLRRPRLEWPRQCLPHLIYASAPKAMLGTLEDRLFQACRIRTGAPRPLNNPPVSRRTDRRSPRWRRISVEKLSSCWRQPPAARPERIPQLRRSLQ